jgi:hypothetical protein
MQLSRNEDPYWTPDDQLAWTLIEMIRAAEYDCLSPLAVIRKAIIPCPDPFARQLIWAKLRELTAEPTLPCPHHKGEQEVTGYESSPGYHGTIFFTVLACGCVTDIDETVWWSDLR